MKEHVPDPQAFKLRSREAVADPKLRENFRAAMDFLIDKRAAQFPQAAAFEDARRLGEQIRKFALAKLPELLERLEAKLTQLGVQVHYAETAADANRIFLALAQRHQAQLMVKGKSMVSEEIELNHAMAAQGVDCVETDMGEYILQLDRDRPSHIIMPAVHKTRQQIADIFAARIPGAPYTEDAEELIQLGRRTLREKFRDAKIGVTGVNFMVAETGTLVLVENEGNGRLCSSVPEVHIAITGIEKVVAKLDHVPPLLALLTRSATGQAITTYVNLITGPRRALEKDGPAELHLILLDNGRTRAYRTERFRATLQCIRCGACMNHCPVYTRVGGHAYGTTYPGPIGAILSPHLQGLKATRDLFTASSLCGACGEVCPVGIPIPDLLMRLREAAQQPADARLDPTPLQGQGSARTLTEACAWKLWSWLYATGVFYRSFLWLATRLRRLTPAYQGGWTRHRAPLRPARRSLRDLLAQRNSRTNAAP